MRHERILLLWRMTLEFASRKMSYHMANNIGVHITKKVLSYGWWCECTSHEKSPIIWRITLEFTSRRKSYHMADNAGVHVTKKVLSYGGWHGRTRHEKILLYSWWCGGSKKFTKKSYNMMDGGSYCMADNVDVRVMKESYYMADDVLSYGGWRILLYDGWWILLYGGWRGRACYEKVLSYGGWRGDSRHEKGPIIWRMMQTYTSWKNILSYNYWIIVLLIFFYEMRDSYTSRKNILSYSDYWMIVLLIFLLWNERDKKNSLRFFFAYT